jgi:VanZ family protein
MNKIFAFFFKYSLIFFWLFFLVSLPLLLMPGGTEPGIPYVDKLAHFLLFFGMGLMGFLAFKKKLVLAFLIIIYMFIIEYIQGHFIPNRSEDILDALVGSLGLLCSYFLFILYNKKMHF